MDGERYTAEAIEQLINNNKKVNFQYGGGVAANDSFYKAFATYCLKNVKDPKEYFKNLENIIYLDEQYHENDVGGVGYVFSLANVKYNIIIEMLIQDSSKTILEKLSNDDFQILLDCYDLGRVSLLKENTYMDIFVSEIIKRQRSIEGQESIERQGSIKLEKLAYTYGAISDLNKSLAKKIYQQIAAKSTIANKSNWIDLSPYTNLLQYTFLYMLSDHLGDKLTVAQGQKYFLELIDPGCLVELLNHRETISFFDKETCRKDLIRIFFKQFSQANNNKQVKIQMLNHVFKKIYLESRQNSESLSRYFKQIPELQKIFDDLYPDIDLTGCLNLNEVQDKHYLMKIFAQSTSFLPEPMLHEEFQEKKLIDTTNRICFSTRKECQEFLEGEIIKKIKTFFKENEKEIQEISKALEWANGNRDSINNELGKDGISRILFRSFIKNTYITAIDQIFTKNRAYSNNKESLEKELCLLKKMYPDLDTTDGYPECLKKLTFYNEMQFKFVYYNVEGSVNGNSINAPVDVIMNKGYFVTNDNINSYIDYLFSAKNACPHIDEAQFKNAAKVIEIRGKNLRSLLQIGTNKQEVLDSFYNNIISEKKDAQYDLPQEVQEIYKFIYEQGCVMASIKPEHFVIELLVLLTAYEEDKKFNIEDPGRHNRFFDEFLEVFLDQRLQKPTITIGTEEIPFPIKPKGKESMLAILTGFAKEMNQKIIDAEALVEIDKENKRLELESKLKKEKPVADKPEKENPFFFNPDNKAKADKAFDELLGNYKEFDTLLS